MDQPQVFLPGDDLSTWDLSRPAFFVPEDAGGSGVSAEPPSWVGWRDAVGISEEESVPPALRGSRG